MAATGVRYAPEDPTLPKPWKGLVDGSTGNLYFWNPVTNTTQYERPVASSNATSAPLYKSTPPVQESPKQRDEEDAYNKDSNGGSTNVASGDGTNHVTQTGETRLDQSVKDPDVKATPGLESNAPKGADRGTIDAYLRRHEITVSGDNLVQPFLSFEATGFPSELLRELRQAGFSAPTPIQAQSWPIAIKGRDIVAIAKTGSGKTLGYLVPSFILMKQRRNHNPKLGPTVLVLSPTRELATQIQDEAEKFGNSSRISCTCLYGGAPKGPQLRDLDRGVDIVVATPGRLNDIMEMRRISLNQVSYLVLDEADRMLDMGFEPQIRKIVKEVPSSRQTLMYTATWPNVVRRIASDLLKNPVQVNIGNVDELAANKSITQHIEVLQHTEKRRRVEQILRSQEPGSRIIIFCSTKKMCDILAGNLTQPYGAAAIHGDKSQEERDRVLNQFRNGRSPVLVATDVAARGLDVKDIRVVINFDFPNGVEDYVHRIGRTGRAGATGLAYTFLSDNDAKHASELVKLLEGAEQRIPDELRDMASRGGGMSRGKRQWSSGGYDGGSGGGYDSSYNSGGRGGGYDSSYNSGGRGGGYNSSSGGRGGWGMSSSPDKGNDSGQRKSFGSESYGGQDTNASTGGSFHERMMAAAAAKNRDKSPPKNSGWGENPRSRSRSPERFNGATGSFHDSIMKSTAKD